MSESELQTIDLSGKNISDPVSLPANPWVGIIQQSIEKGADITAIEKFITLQREEEDRQAERAFNDALSELQSNMPEISKTGKASFKTKAGGVMEYNFDQLNDICNAIRPLLQDVGLSYSWDQVQDERGITVRCTIKHKHGHSIENKISAPPDGSGLKNAIQQIASTVSYLQRYTLKAALGIASTDDDGAASNQQSMEKQEKVKFLRWMATAKIEMGKSPNPEDLEEYYNKAVSYSSLHNQKFVIELQEEYTNIKQNKGW